MSQMTVNTPSQNGVITSSQNANGTYTSKESAVNSKTGQTVNVEATGRDLMATQNAVSETVQKALGATPGAGDSILPNVVQGEPAGSNMPGVSILAATTMGSDGSSTSQAERFNRLGAETRQFTENTTPTGSPSASSTSVSPGTGGWSTSVDDELFSGDPFSNSGEVVGTAQADGDTAIGSQDAAESTALSYLNDMNPQLPESVQPGVTSLTATRGEILPTELGRIAFSQAAQGGYDATSGGLLGSSTGRAFSAGASALGTGSAEALDDAQDSPLEFTSDTDSQLQPASAQGVGSTAVPTYPVEE